MSSKWQLMPSLRVATFSHFNKLNEDVLLESDLKTKLCRHGETGSSIRTWIQAEARARANGKEPPRRPSVCTCTSTHGLQNHTLTQPPTPPACVYDVLVANEAVPINVGEDKPALKLGDHDFYLTASGNIYCTHKSLLKPITKAKRPYVFKSSLSARCACTLSLPRRTAKVCLGRRDTVRKHE